MHEMCAIGIFFCKFHNVVVGSGGKGTRAEGQAIVRIGNGIEEFAYILVACDDARQSKNLQRGIVGMDTHIDVVFIAYRHYGIKKICHVFTQLVGIDALVELQQVAEFPYRVEIIFRDIAVDEALGLDDDIVYETFFQPPHSFWEPPLPPSFPEWRRRSRRELPRA